MKPKDGNKMSKKQGCVLVPAKWRKKIESGAMRQKHGLESDSGSRYTFLRTKGGCADTEAQYLVYKGRGIIKDKKYAIFDSDVKAKDKYHVTTLPTKFFSNRKDAHKYAKKRGWETDDYKVMTW